MAESDEAIMLYSIQKTYILTHVFMSGKGILTCNQRIDIPTIEPLLNMGVVDYNQTRTVVPCIELVGDSLGELDMVFETNEGVTVLPVEIKSGRRDPLKNPYQNSRHVLVLPRGTTGVKSCKIFIKGENIEVQHNFTFGIMPPPYNYDNALFGYLSYRVNDNSARIATLEDVTSHYGYAKRKLTHDIDFSDISLSFTINPDTRFLTFSVTNPLKTATKISIILRSRDNPSKNTSSTFQVSPGQNSVKVDLQVLAVFVQNDDANKADSYIIPPIEDRGYGAIRFNYSRNANLPGKVTVIEWA